MKFLKSKKGFSLTELMIVVLVLGILTAVAVPVYNGVSKTKRIDDCYGNRVVISNVLREAMVGMLDNGKKQDTIVMEYANQEHIVFSPADFPEGYANQKCFILSTEDTTITLGDIRGGYRTTGDYAIGCETGHYLKRKDLENVKFYTYLANQEIPQCAFEETDKVDYHYYIFSDATVLCDCPECVEAMKK